jgi:hypothetical protein
MYIVKIDNKEIARYDNIPSARKSARYLSISKLDTSEIWINGKKIEAYTNGCRVDAKDNSTYLYGGTNG